MVDILGRASTMEELCRWFLLSLQEAAKSIEADLAARDGQRRR
jgi:hypothetical protein